MNAVLMTKDAIRNLALNLDVGEGQVQHTVLKMLACVAMYPGETNDSVDGHRYAPWA